MIFHSCGAYFLIKGANSGSTGKPAVQAQESPQGNAKGLGTLTRAHARAYRRIANLSARAHARAEVAD
jgi:hypothetical protein